MDTKKLAKSLLEKVGGEDNISELTHCFTRLRFVLKNKDKADKKAIEKLEGVVQVVEAYG